MWRIGHKTRHRENAPLAMTLTVQSDEENPGRVCQVFLRSKRIKGDPRYYSHKATLNPQDVREVVAHALKLGWDPAERGASFKINPGPDTPELADYELVEW